MEYLGILIGIAIFIFIIWFLPKALKGWKVSWVGLIITGFLALMTYAVNDLGMIVFFVLWVLYYVIAFIIFKAIKEIRTFITKKK